MKLPPLVVIEWEDAFNGNHAWTALDEVPEAVLPLTMETVGFEIRRSKERTTLAGSFQPLQEDGQDRTRTPKVADLFTIPAGCILKRTVLRK